MSTITVKNAVKKFKNSTVIDNVSLTLEGGNIYGFVGRNGSGKHHHHVRLTRGYSLSIRPAHPHPCIPPVGSIHREGCPHRRHTPRGEDTEVRKTKI